MSRGNHNTDPTDVGQRAERFIAFDQDGLPSSPYDQQSITGEHFGSNLVKRLFARFKIMTDCFRVKKLDESVMHSDHDY